MADFRLRYEFSPQHHTAIIDHSYIVTMSDQISDRVSITLTRLTSRPIAEMARKYDDGRLEIRGGPDVEMEQVRIVEFTADMRPDQARALASAIEQGLQKLTPESRKRSGLGDK